MRLMKRSLFLFVALLATSFFTQTVRAADQVPTPSSQVSLDKLPSDIQALLKKDPQTLTDEEKDKLAPLLRPTLAQPPVTPPTGTVNCFDYYHFGSVQVDLSPTLSTTLPGLPLTFTGTVKNANDYPLVGGSVYVKIFKKQADDSLTHQNGPQVVDQFFVKEGIALPAKGEMPLSFDWNIPRSTESGDYQAAFFFTTARRFNLLGLSFTDDVVGNTANFSIQSDVTSGVSFDKNTVTMNGNLYHFAAFPPHFKKDETVKAELKLVNTTKEDQSIPVLWKQYDWDGLRQENLVDSKDEVIALKAGETKTISYEATKYKGAVTYLIAEAQYQDTHSYLDMRFVRDGIDQVRMNFPSITSFPLKANQETTVFACAHSTNSPIVNGTELTLELKDMQGKTIHTYAYQGGITGDMMGVKDSFTPKETYDRFILSTTLKKDGKVVEALDIKYDCENIDPTLCVNQAKTGGVIPTIGKRTSLALALALAFFLGLLGWKLWQSKHQRNVLSFLFTVIVSGALLFGVAGKTAYALSSSVSVTKNTSPWLAYYWNYGGSIIRGSQNGWSSGLRNTSATVTYRARVIDMGTGLEAGTTVTTGTRLRFEAIPYQDTDISWFGTGYGLDSPYGHWINNANHPGAFCAAGDFVGMNRVQEGERSSIVRYGSGYYSLHIPFSVNPPVVTYNHFGSTARLSCDVTGQNCTVMSSGVIIGNVNFTSTYGKFYYSYINPPARSAWGFPAGCTSNNIPMREIVGFHRELFGLVPDVAESPYILNFDSKVIRFTLTANAAPNAAPTVPTLSVDSPSKPVATPFTFTATATDPDADTLRYGLDYDNNSTVDQWVPGAGYVASGTPQSTNYSWLTPGTYTVKALAQDSKGAQSGWSLPVTVTTTAAPTLTFTATSPVAYNGATTLTWTPTGATSCWASGDWTGWVASSGTNTSVQSGLMTNKSYTLQCWDGMGTPTGPKTVTVTVTMPAAPTVSLLVNGSHSPAALTSGAAENISWTTTNAVSCTASSSDGFAGSKAIPTGSEAKTATVTSTETLTCVNAIGTSSSDSVAVNVSCTPSTGAYGACNCATEQKTRTNINATCLPWTESTACDPSEKNACRDFNWKEVAP